MSLDFKEFLGISKSYGVYYGIPFRRGRLKRFHKIFINKGDLCFDVGSHIGNRVRAFLDCGAKVVAVEPQPNFAKLLYKFYSNNPHFHLEETGISSKVGLETLYLSKKNPTVTSFSKTFKDKIQSHPLSDDIIWDKEIKIPVSTLDELIKKYGIPEYCKLDIEGYESKALIGLSKAIPKISFEFIPINIDDSYSCIEQLEKLGNYRYNFSMVETMKFSLPKFVSSEILRGILEKMPKDGRSGDIYAFLEKKIL